ncbi:hypothetical protein ACWC1D_32445 [Streptomyces sp. NPDC001478]
MPDYLPHSELTASDLDTFETLMYRQMHNEDARLGSPLLRLDGWELYDASHGWTPQNVPRTEGYFRRVPFPGQPPPGEDGPVRMRFDSTGEALPDGRRYPPPATRLTEFAEAITSRFPGWECEIRTLEDRDELRGQLWDQIVLDHLLRTQDVPEVALLTGPSHTRFVAVPVPRAGAPVQIVLGALRPPDPTGALDLSNRTAPAAIVVPNNPVAAAATVNDVLLPHYEDALLRLRIQTLQTAAEGIVQALAAWDAASDTLCDSDGWPLDDAVYADGKVARDAKAWRNVEIFLAHGPQVLAYVRTAARGSDYVEGPVSDGLRRLRGIETTLDHAGKIHTEWDEVMALMDDSLPGSRELYKNNAMEIRNSEGWHYAEELTRQGPALTRTARHLADRAQQADRLSEARSHAALARSTASSIPSSLPAPSLPPPSNPGPPRHSR